MNITDELERLGRLHKDGTLSDEEFAQAKSRLLSQPADSEPRDLDSSLGQAANRYVSYRMVMGVIGAIIFIIFFLVMTSSMNRQSSSPFPQPTFTITPNR
jgi:hypothetical protein